MPVSFGRWLSNSVKASSPPAEAPTPTTRGSTRSSGAGCAIATGETGFTAALLAFPFALVPRFGDESRRRGERAPLLGRRLTVFSATRHQYPPFTLGRTP